jgi:symplekin
VTNPGGAAISVSDDTGATILEYEDPVSFTKPVSHHVASTEDDTQTDLTIKIKNEDMISEGPPISGPDRVTPKTEALERPVDHRVMETTVSLDPGVSSTNSIEEDQSTVNLLDDTETNGADSSSILEFDQFSLDVQVSPTSEDTCLELPQLPPYIQLSQEHESKVKHMAISHIIESYKHLHGAECQQFCMPLLSRLVAQVKYCFVFLLFQDSIIFEDINVLFLFLVYIFYKCGLPQCSNSFIS